VLSNSSSRTTHFGRWTEYRRPKLSLDSLVNSQGGFIANGFPVTPRSRFQVECRLLVIVSQIRVPFGSQRNVKSRLRVRCSPTPSVPLSSFMPRVNTSPGCVVGHPHWTQLWPVHLLHCVSSSIVSTSFLSFPPLGAFPSGCLLQPPEYLSRVLSLALASEYRSVMPMLGRTPCH
jgi:hypothetical protein